MINPDYQSRRAALMALRHAVLRHEQELLDALRADLGKDETEAYMCEVGLLLSDLRYTLQHLRRWMRPRRVAAPLSSFPAGSRILREPYGHVLVMAPWNYPVLLSLQPLAGALAAGNEVTLKPSELAPASADVVARIVEELRTDPATPLPVSVVTGGPDVASALLDRQWDYIFYTGNPRVGRIVMEKAARHLTPVTLELGGKSPVIVDRTADLPLAARRIVFGKFLNAGQTCVAPDYVLCDAAVRQRLVELLREEIRRQYPDGCGRIINERHYRRLEALAGQAPDRPIVLDGVCEEHPAMQEEIFGPVLPVLEVGSIDEAIAFVNARPKPLALYLFSRDRRVQRRVLGECSFGGGCVNDTIMHLSQHNLPFGGVGESGMGAYHGRTTYDTFTHAKSVVDRGLWLDPFFRYHPYGAAARRLIRMFLR